MRNIDFNKDWKFYRLSSSDTVYKVDLPHDATFSETRLPSNPSGRHGCWFAGGDYVYEKNFEYSKGIVYFEFESVYRRPEIFINGKLVATRDYGYTRFIVCADEFLNQGENLLTVKAYNSDQPNSRWYSGSGILRPVTMHILPEKHILMDGVKIKTTDYKIRTVKTQISTCCGGELTLLVVDGEKEIYSSTITTDGFIEHEFSLVDAKLWDAENPNLYTLKVKFYDDEYAVRFGIRQVECNAKSGLIINGNRTILKGACIHHDNGTIGGAGHPFADFRKVKLLKELGYNAIRSAHNPVSKAVMDACDRLGMYILDEYVDMWYIHKTRYDYADYFEKNHLNDLDEMVEKDYNCPSVIMYSVGNEVSETAEKRGIDLCKEMTEHIHKKDDRPVTCGVNIFFNYLSSLGFGVYSDKKAKDKKNDNAVGSEFFNMLAGKLGDKTMKIGATLGGCDRKTKHAFSNLDIAGYNYGILRYEKDCKKYPDRVILGTETFCKDALKFMRLAEKHPQIIGDFVWAGMDYLGEVAVGSWVYKPYTPTFSPSCGWMTAGSGRIDIIGNSDGEGIYTQVAFGLKELGLAVVPADKCFEPHSPSAWKMSNAMPSWTFDGCDGKKTIVEAYTRAHKIKLYINDELVGVKKPDGNGVAKFKVTYQKGELKAVAFDKNGNEVATEILRTGGDQTTLTVTPEQRVIDKDGLCYVKLDYTDGNGTLKPLASGEISVEVSGGKLIALGNACPYNADGYNGDKTKVYYGRAQAIIKPSGLGEIIITAKSPFGDKTESVTVK